MPSKGVSLGILGVFVLIGATILLTRSGEATQDKLPGKRFGKDLVGKEVGVLLRDAYPPHDGFDTTYGFEGTVVATYPEGLVLQSKKSFAQGWSQYSDGRANVRYRTKKHTGKVTIPWAAIKYVTPVQ